MVDHGTYLSVDEAEATVAELLRAVREGGRPVRILSRGEPVAEVSAVSAVKRRRPLPAVDPKLRAKLLVPGHELTTPEDWPDDCR